MPGIAGIIGQLPIGHAKALTHSMVTSMAHESFYQTGFVCSPELGICAGLVSHPGSFAAQESGDHESGAVSVAFSGECFNVPRQSRGTFIADQYQHRGKTFVSSLNGLFSGLVIDKPRGQALLFNDRYSSERIYYHQTSDALYFASEAKALLRVLPQLRQFDSEGVAQQFAYGCTMGERTLFKGVSLLAGGTCWIFQSNGRNHRASYFKPSDFENVTPLTPEQYIRDFGETFAQILPRYCDAGESLGISLTGGLDTRMIMACLKPAVPRQICYTFAGPSHNLLDSRIAARIARSVGLEHHNIRIGAPFLRQYSDHLDKTVFVTDGTAGALCAHERYLNSLARVHSTIRLTGNFGSEILRGASTFKAIGLDRNLFNPDWRTRAAHGEHYREPRQGVHPTTFSVFQEVPWNLFGTTSASRSQVTFRTPYLDNDLVALSYRAPDELRHSATPALGLIRLNNPTLGAIPTDRGRTVDSNGIVPFLRRASAELSFKLDYMHKEGLPSSLAPLSIALGALDRANLLGQHKFLAYRLWFRSELRAQISAVLLDRRTLEMPFWDRRFLCRMLDAHARGSRNLVREIGTVLTFESIQRNLLRWSPSNEDVRVISNLRNTAPRTAYV